MKREVVIAAVCLVLGVAAGHFFLRGAVSPPAATASKPAYTMPNYEPGNQGNGPASLDRLAASPRHQETVAIKVPGVDQPMKAFIVYPERPDKAPVVLCIMEIYGMTDWVKAATDQLAADGFIALAPDFTSLKPAGTAVSAIPAAEIMADLNAARDYGLKLPAANGKSATVGFCWGGGMSFSYAAAQPDLNAAVVFYGTPPADGELPRIKAPIAGFYGGSDARVTATVAPTTEKMKTAGKSYDPHVYDGAGHGFMRAQTPGPNAKAAQEAWPLVVKFLKDNTKAG